MIKLDGVVTEFYPAKSMGFILAKQGGTTRKFFFHLQKVILCECDYQEIHTGMTARFAVSPIPPKQDALPYATHVELRQPAVDTAAVLAVIGGAR